RCTRARRSSTIAPRPAAASPRAASPRASAVTSPRCEAAVKQHAPATERNREPIREVLARVLPATGTVLEIASGSGEHAVAFARAFPALTWQPSDTSPAALASISAWRAEAGLPNLA